MSSFSRSASRHPRRRTGLHQRRRVGRAPARARRGSDRQPARRGRHRDAGDADPDRRRDRRHRGLGGRRDRRDHRRPVPARDDRDGARRDLGDRVFTSRVASTGRGSTPTSRRSTATCSSSWSSSPPGSRSARRRRCRPRCTSRSRSSSCSPTSSTCARPCAAGARAGGRVDRTASTSTAIADSEPGGGLIALQFAVGLGAIVGGAHLFVEEMISVAEEHRRRAAGALARPRAAGHRAAGEGQQLLLGARRQGQPGARQHHRRDGLPVDDPDRLRPRVHRVGARQIRRPLRACSD